MPNKILLNNADSIQKERPADGSITPGHLIELKSTGKVGVHSTAGGIAQKSFAINQDFIGGSIDKLYADGDNVIYHVCAPGTEIYGLIASGVSVSIGGALESAGDGTLKARSSGALIAYALETKVAVASTRLKVEVA